MVKDAIGILDMGVEGFSIVETLALNFKHERIVYLNDLFHQPYSGRVEDEVKQIIKNNMNRIMKENLKLLIITSDVIIDIVGNIFDDLHIPVFNVVSLLLEYVNQNYEQKNLVLLAKNQIISANLYQKNFKYNRLFNIASDELEAMIYAKMIKTSKSFYTTLEIFKPVIKKDIDIIITSSPFLIKLKTEIKEYVTFNEITDIGNILTDKIKEEVLDLVEKGKGEVVILSNVNKKKFEEVTYWSKLKYKYLDYSLEENEVENIKK